VARPAAIGLIVSDLPRAIAFYSLLGLEFPADYDVSHGHVEAPLPGGLRFMLDTVETIRSFDPDWTAPVGGHRIAVAYECDSPADVDATFAQLVASGGGGQREPWDAFWGQRYAQVQDPDGNLVDLFAPLAR
jgi:catechol 2,3-dioxygenase-like lactoylglutathione lyase family enzyme